MISLSLTERIKNTLDEIRPMLARHLGDVEFVKFENGIVYVHMLGMCKGCPLSQLTLKAGIEELMKSKISEVERVEAM